MNTAKLAVSLLGLPLLAAVPTASAASYSYYWSQPDYVVPQGGTVAVPLYLQETLDNVDEVPRFGADNGLSFVSFVLSGSNSSVTFSQFAPTAAWDPDFTAITDNGAGNYEISIMSPLTNGVSAEPDPAGLEPNVRRVLLGNLTFFGQGNAGESTSLMASYSSLGISMFVGEEYLAEDVNSADITVTVLPEPATLSLLVLGTSVFLRRSRRCAR